MDEKPKAYYDWLSKTDNRVFLKNEAIEEAYRLWQAAQPQWQPIETAPREEAILVFCKAIPERGIEQTVEKLWFYTGQDHPTSKNRFCICDTATHWMPLPPPPPQQ